MSERRIFVEEAAITTVALAIVRLMREVGVTQHQLAERLEISDPRMSQIVNGTGNLTVKTLARIADALGREMRVSFHRLRHE